MMSSSAPHKPREEGYHVDELSTAKKQSKRTAAVYQCDRLSGPGSCMSPTRGAQLSQMAARERELASVDCVSREIEAWRDRFQTDTIDGGLMERCAAMSLMSLCGVQIGLLSLQEHVAVDGVEQVTLLAAWIGRLRLVVRGQALGGSCPV